MCGPGSVDRLLPRTDWAKWHGGRLFRGTVSPHLVVASCGIGTALPTPSEDRGPPAFGARGLRLGLGLEAARWNGRDGHGLAGWRREQIVEVCRIALALGHRVRRFHRASPLARPTSGKLCVPLVSARQGSAVFVLPSHRLVCSGVSPDTQLPELPPEPNARLAAWLSR